jgi:hypothetical protein
MHSGEAVGGRGTGGEDGRSWCEILMTLCVVTGVFGTGSWFERYFMDGRCMRNVSDARQAGVMACRRDIHERLKNACFVDPPIWILIWTVERKVYCKALY